VSNSDCRIIKVKRKIDEQEQKMLKLLCQVPINKMDLFHVLNLRLIGTYYKFINRNKSKQLLDGVFVEQLILNLEKSIDKKWNRSDYLSRRNSGDLSLFLCYYDVPDAEIICSVRNILDLMTYMPYSPIRVLKSIIG